MKLYNCKSEQEQVQWAIEHLNKGGRIHDDALWLGGVDRPMLIVAGVKCALRAEGKFLAKAIETVRDAEGEEHEVLAWRLALRPTSPGRNQTSTKPKSQ